MDLEVPFPTDRHPTDEEARDHGYVDAKDWFAKSTAAKLATPELVELDYRGLPFAPPDGPADREESLLATSLGMERPYLLVDVEPGMKFRAESCKMFAVGTVRDEAPWSSAPCSRVDRTGWGRALRRGDLPCWVDRTSEGGLPESG